MKNISFLYIALIAFAFTKCIKEPDSVKGPDKPIDTTTVVVPIDTPKVDSFYITAILKGKPWKAQYTTFWDQNKVPQMPKDECSIQFGELQGNSKAYGADCGSVPLKEGRFEVHIHDTKIVGSQNLHSFFLVYDNDNIIGWYHPDSTQNNYIEITKLDTVNKVMEGNFEIFHNRYINPNWPLEPAPLPDTANFRNGRFRIKME